MQHQKTNLLRHLHRLVVYRAGYSIAQQTVAPDLHRRAYISSTRLQVSLIQRKLMVGHSQGGPVREGGEVGG